MRNYCKIIGALAAASALAAGNASAIDLSYNLHAGYSSIYLFRGLNLGTDLIEAGVDVSADLGNGFTASAGAWYGSFDAPAGLGGLAPGLGDLDRSADELDLYAKVSKDLGFATVSVGYIYYFNNQSEISEFIFPVDDTQEVTFGISKEVFGVNLGLTYYWEIEDGTTDSPFFGPGDSINNDGYAELTASKSFELNSCLTLNVGSALGYLVERGHLAHLTTKVSLDYAFAEGAKLSPFIAGSLDLSGGHGDYYGAAKNQLLAGAMVSVDF